MYQARRARRRLALLGACRRRGVLRQPGWWPPAPARHWYAGRLGGARCRETPALGSREKWLSFPYTPGLAQRLSQHGQRVIVVDQEASTAYRNYRASLARGDTLFFQAMRRKEAQAYFRRAVLGRSSVLARISRDRRCSECALTAVIRHAALLIPRPALVLQPADEVLAVVHTSQAPELAALLGEPA